jgi:hypothetical protein
MPVPWKYQRLLLATQRFNSFHRFVDLITVGLFFVVAISALNKFLSKPLVDWEFFDMSWKTIGSLFVVFFVLLVNQLNQELMRRELSAFQREAALKAARKAPRYRR